MPAFILGLKLARMFYDEIVRPILDRDYPDLPHSAGMLGPGSETLGFDDEMSTDHNWGLQFVIYLRDEDHPDLAEPLRALLSERLPYAYRGFFTHFEKVPEEGSPGGQ